MYKKNPNKKCGSILVYCVIILAMMLVIASGMSFVTTSEKKDATTTQASAQAIQTADSGLQLGIKAINSNLGKSLTDTFGNCDASSGIATVSGTINSGSAQSKYYLTFQDGTTLISSCSTVPNTVANMQIQSTGMYKNAARSVSTKLSVPCPSTVKDKSGNTYNTVTIGSACWMASNLETTKKPDGTNLTLGTDYYCPPNVTNTGADCAAVTNAATNKIGYLYTWNTAMNGSAAASAAGAEIQGICPDGWHIPSEHSGATKDDWPTLFTAVSNNISSLELNDTTNYWTNTVASQAFTNASGFGGVGAGLYNGGSYSNRGTWQYFWASSDSGSSGVANYQDDAFGSSYHLYYSESISKSDAISVRCVKN